MVKVDSGGENFYLDGYAKSNLDILKERVYKKKRDACIIIDGREGWGKSTYGQQIAKYLDPTFEYTGMTFGLAAWKKKIIESKPCQAIVGDEMFDLFLAKGAMETQNKEVMKILAKVRQKRLFLILICPSVFELNRYAPLHRADCLFHVFSGDNDQLGFFSFFERQKLQKLYIKGKKFMDYKCVRPSFYGRFTKQWVIDQEKYDCVKTKDLDDVLQSKVTGSLKHRDKLDKVLFLLAERLGKNTRELGELTDMPKETVRDAIKRAKEGEEADLAFGEGGNRRSDLGVVGGNK